MVPVVQAVPAVPAIVGALAHSHHLQIALIISLQKFVPLVVREVVAEKVVMAVKVVQGVVAPMAYPTRLPW